MSVLQPREAVSFESLVGKECVVIKSNSKTSDYSKKKVVLIKKEALINYLPTHEM